MSEIRNSNLLGKITVLVVVVLCVNTAVALDGSGMQEDPWLIKSLEDFNDFAADANYWDDYTRLETDVNLAGMVYSGTVIGYFTGVFDGNDHKILNLTIDAGGYGLFSGNGGEVKNLGLEGGSVSGHSSVGGLCGGNSGTISNCYSTGSVSGDRYVGGLVGRNRGGELFFCYSTCNVNGVDFVGGRVGRNEWGTITNCYSKGSVRGDESVGGLAGFNHRSWVYCCYSTSFVIGTNNVGGLVGDNYDPYEILNCYSTGDVNGVRYVGGLVGNNTVLHFRSDISQSYSTSDVSGSYSFYEVGGLIGYNDDYNCEVWSCFWDTDTQTHGVTKSIGLSYSYFDVTGLPTPQMQTRSTFTSAASDGWDFVGETVNGTEDIWTIHEEVDYPKFIWELVNFIGWYNVDFLDFAFFANHWLENNCGVANDCEGTDLDFSDKVDEADLKIFCDHWLEGVQ